MIFSSTRQNEIWGRDHLIQKGETCIGYILAKVDGGADIRVIIVLGTVDENKWFRRLISLFIIWPLKN